MQRSSGTVSRPWADLWFSAVYYANLILNPQKVAFEAKMIEDRELRGALAYLMRSRDVYQFWTFWTKVRTTRVETVRGDVDEDFFTALVDEAYDHAPPPTGEAGA